MATVVVSSTVKALEVPLSVVVQGYAVTVVGVATQIVPNPTATFADVPPGDYEAQMSLVDKDGVLIGEVQSAKFNVPVTVQSVSVPDVVSVTVS
jgi:hypothetical protein